MIGRLQVDVFVMGFPENPSLPSKALAGLILIQNLKSIKFTCSAEDPLNFKLRRHRHSCLAA